MDSMIERKKLLARKRATKKKIKLSTNKNELKLFDFIYFNPSDNPMPTKYKKLSETTTSIDKITSNNINRNNSLENVSNNVNESNIRLDGETNVNKETETNGSTSTDTILSTSTDNIISTSTDNIISTSTDNIISTSTDNIISTSDNIISTSTDNIISTSTDNIISTSTDTVLSKSNDSIENVISTTSEINNKSTSDVDTVASNMMEFNDLLEERQEEERIENENLEEPNENSNDTSSNDHLVAAPQLKIGPNGELILDEKSLSIRTTAAKINENRVIETVEENDDSYQYGKYNRKRRRSTDWTFKETARFYKALSTVGTDFLLMQSLFKWRSREELKLKFKKEEKSHRELVDRALLDSTQFDFSIFEESDYDPEEDRKATKTEDAKRKKELLKEQKKKLKEIKIKEKKELIKQNKERKKLLRQTFKPKKDGLRRNTVQVIDEDSNDSRATSILVDAQEVIFEMTLFNNDRNNTQEDNESIVSDHSVQTELNDCLPEVEQLESEVVGEKMRETWFAVNDIQTDEMNEKFVELKVDNLIKKIPVPAVKENTSHIVVVEMHNKASPIYHVYLATCNDTDGNKKDTN